MANTVTTTKIIETTKYSIIHVYITGDGSGEETGTVIYDYSADVYAPTAKTQLSLVRFWGSVDSTISIDLVWDGATDFNVWCVPQYTPARDVDFSFFGGIKNLATTPTGDLVFNTIGLGASDHASIVVVIRKV